MVGTLCLLPVSCGSGERATRASEAGRGATGPEKERLPVVASTNVYGAVAKIIGGDRVQVSSIIRHPNTEMHDYSVSARVRPDQPVGC